MEQKKIRKPKPPRKIVRKIESVEKKTIFYKLKVKRNSILNRYYYPFLFKFHINIRKFVKYLIKELLDLLWVGIWGIIITLTLYLFNFNYNYKTYLASVGLVYLSRPVSKFIYKIKRG